MFSFKDRLTILNTLNQYAFDVLVIGGGITGAGIALDAASRGLSVALIDMQDFSSGTSSRSTKLVHGGLRYLKQLEVGLVAEVGKEREVIYENAVHVTQPEWMLLPLYNQGSLGKLSTSIALKLYDQLAKVRKHERHKMLSAKQTLTKIPFLKKEGLLGAGYYVEYKTDDARLTIEALKKAVEYKAVCLNYAKVTDFVYEKKKMVAANVRDEISGKTITIHAGQIVNATGPWVDDIRNLDKVQNNKYLRLTKGVHIVLDQSILPLHQAVYFDTEDGRMVFAIPREGKTYVGTTDTFYQNDPIHPVATQEDIDYLIKNIQYIFPTIDITVNDVESSWAGIRPLIYEKGKNPYEISRKDEIWISPSGLMTIAGGKLTGYRQMAERIVDKIIKIKHYKHATGCITKELSLSGSKGLNSKNFGDYVLNKAREGEILGIPYMQAKHLVEKYGTNVDEVFNYVIAIKQSQMQIPETIYAQLLYSIYNEMAYTPADFFIRRTGLLYFDINCVENFKDAVIDIMDTIIGYSESEKKLYKSELEQFIEDAKNPKK